MFCKIISVFIGGGIGAILRFFVTLASRKYFPGLMMNPVFSAISPSIFATFLVNIVGCFLLGLVFGLTLNKFQNISETLKIFITVGFLGGLTTFSTFNLEIFEFLKAGKTLEAFLYMFLSCIFGLLFTFSGYLFSKTNLFNFI